MYFQKHLNEERHNKTQIYTANGRLLNLSEYKNLKRKAQVIIVNKLSKHPRF